MGRPLLVTPEIVDILTDMIKGKDGVVRKVTAKDALNGIYEKTHQHLKKGEIPPQLPDISRIHKEIRRITLEQSDSTPLPEDAPYTIGACLEYNIPLTPELLELYRKHTQGVNDGRLSKNITIREARWFTQLYPQLEPIIKANYKHPEKAQWLVFIISTEYARQEQIADINKHTSDTKWLDNKYFFEQDFSDILEGWLRTEFPKQYQKAEQALENFKPLPAENLELVLGKLTKEDVELFNKYLYNCFLSRVHPMKGKKTQDSLFKKHPNLVPLTQKWLKWSAKKEGEE